MFRALSLVLICALFSACERAPKSSASEKDSEKRSTEILSSPAPEPVKALELSRVPFPDETARLQLFDDLVSEMARLDAEAMEARRLRSESWDETLRGLRIEMAASRSFTDMARVLLRVDASYTNLHSYVDFVAEGQWFEGGSVQPRAWVATEITDGGRSRFVLELSDSTWQTPELLGLASGDEVISLNGRSLRAWSDENFNFCKFPLKLQCDQELFENFVSDKLSWKRSDPIKLGLRRSDGTEIVIDVPYSIKRSTPEEREARTRKRIERYECARSADRYPGFSLVYAGNRACVFEKDGDASTAILRITSFSYDSSLLFPEQKIRSLHREVDLLESFWKSQAGAWSHLVIDLVDNTGGNSPIPYYQLLFEDDFQEQFYRLKRVPEMEDPSFLESLVWEDPAQLRTYALLKKEGLWSKPGFGELLPQLPMFCPDESRDCRRSLFSPKPHPFSGRVSLLMNRMCISSCDGFVWAVSRVMGARARLFGQPQAADSTYARGRIDVEWTEDEGFRTRVMNQRSPVSSEVLFSQVVALSLSTDAEGSSIAGRPLPLTRFVGSDPLDRRVWATHALEAALATP